MTILAERSGGCTKNDATMFAWVLAEIEMLTSMQERDCLYIDHK